MARMVTNISAIPTPMDHVSDMLQYFVTLPTIPYTDLTIQSENASIRVHAAILGSFSPMISSLLGSLSNTSPHPFLPGMSPTSPRISVPHTSKSSLSRARELLYTGYCVGTEDEMKQVQELLGLLGVEDSQFSLEAAVECGVISDTLELATEDSFRNEESSIDLQEDIQHSEQVAVQEQEQRDESVQSVQYEEFDQHQFPAFLHDKFTNPHPEMEQQSVQLLPRTRLTILNQVSGQSNKPTRKNITMRSFFCQHCHMKFEKLKDKEMHALIEHSYELPFVCQECGHRFKVKEDVEMHMKLHGGGSYQLKCEVCEQVCKSMSQYHIHYKGHSGLKEFGCSKCGKSFTNLTNLKNHEKVHQPMRFSCGVCGKPFRRKDNLKNHHKKHHEVI
eukprot:GFUD01020812.1.p1 GENE.GFUD01020812.1~~GFUD01020812.1.p1  ORF type:complete len:389 (+),score=72.89 GFUD01020812.1:52-1218(+)